MQTKRYFVTSETANKFPPEFINSRNRKFIIVRNCKVLFEKAVVDDVELHACKYEYFGDYPYFNIWFTDMHGNMIKPDAFTVRFLLVY